MKAKWLWTTWTHLALVGILALQAVFMLWVMVKIMPAYAKYSQEKWLMESDAPGILSWTQGFLQYMVGVSNLIVHYWFLWVVVLAVLWGLFEWRTRGENKPLMRLSALATAAMAFMIPVALTALALIVQLALALPAKYTRNPEPDVRRRYESMNQAVAALDDAMTKHDWNAIQQQSNRLRFSIGELARVGSAAPVLLVLENQPKIDHLRTQLKSAEDTLQESHDAIEKKDMSQLEGVMGRFREAYNQVRQDVTKSPK